MFAPGGPGPRGTFDAYGVCSGTRATPTPQARVALHASAAYEYMQLRVHARSPAGAPANTYYGFTFLLFKVYDVFRLQQKYRMLCRTFYNDGISYTVRWGYLSRTYFKYDVQRKECIDYYTLFMVSPSLSLRDNMICSTG